MTKIENGNLKTELFVFKLTYARPDHAKMAESAILTGLANYVTVDQNIPENFVRLVSLTNIC